MARDRTPLDDPRIRTRLRHLGAAYYESLHGRATRADVTRALETVEEHLNEQPAHPHPVRQPPTAGGQDRLRHPRGWSR